MHFRAYNHQLHFLASLEVPADRGAAVAIDTHHFLIGDATIVALRRGARALSDLPGAASLTLEDGTVLIPAPFPYFDSEVAAMREALRVAQVLRLAELRGRSGNTFATAEELRTPGYSEAWSRGADSRPPVVAEGHTFEPY